MPAETGGGGRYTERISPHVTRMGAGSSLPSRETLTSETYKTKNILNGILQFMLAESDLLDMYALASDKRCDEYTIFTANSLDSFFKKIQMSPTQSKDGALYFQDVYTLKRLSGKTGEKHKENCLELSRFFIRILHIFSALSLTVMDMEIPQDNRSLNEIGKRAVKDRVNEKSIRSIPFLRTGQTGGAILDITGSEYSRYYIGKGTQYEVLNQYISVDRQMGYYYFDKYRTLYLYANSLTSPSVNPRFTYSYTKPIKNNNKPSKPIDIEGYFTFEREMGSPILKVTFGILSPREYATVSTDNFKNDGSHYTWNNKKIPDYIMYKIEDAVGESKNINNRRITRRSNLNKLSKEITEPSFQVTGFLDALKAPPKAYCVARALQLLSPESIFYSSNSSTVRTQICDTGFTLLGKGSLPKSGNSITTSASIMSLYVLFFDTLDKAVPKISAETRPKYDEFVKTMRAVYEEESVVKNINTNMTTIKNARNPLCSDKTKALALSDSTAINNLSSSAATLLSKQLQHTEKVMNILKKLFVITPTRPILLHPDVEKGGMAAIERIAAEARDLLVDYYSTCEITYRDAVQDLKERIDTNPSLLT
jgi:hypothetical protein